jgi:hypothetical protein
MIEYPEIMVACIKAANHPGNELAINEVGAWAVQLYDEIVGPFADEAAEPEHPEEGDPT